ncbi:MAG: hypothetical protein J3R72DRAFT_374483, partial [Linnemannia gamsii]
NSKVPVRCLLSSPVYVQRLQVKLNAMEFALNCSHHRAFLASLILVSKYLSYGRPWNNNRAKHSTIFSLAEVNSMEN